jgi:hypothetical protein
MEPIEPLDPVLSSHISVEERIGKVLRHPLVYAVPYSETLNPMLNRQLRHKRIALRKAWENKDWHRFVFLYEKPYRLHAFMEIKDKVEYEVPLTYASLMTEIWGSTEFVWRDFPMWKALWKNIKPNQQEQLMREDERAMLNSLSQRVTIHRGATLGLNELGISWTLDFDKAKWFATRLRKSTDVTVVVSATINRSDIIALFLGRGETEVIALPEKCRTIKTSLV